MTLLIGRSRAILDITRLLPEGATHILSFPTPTEDTALNQPLNYYQYKPLFINLSPEAASFRKTNVCSVPRLPPHTWGVFQDHFATLLLRCLQPQARASYKVDSAIFLRYTRHARTVVLGVHKRGWRKLGFAALAHLVLLEASWLAARCWELPAGIHYRQQQH